MGRIVQWHTKRGEPIRAGGSTVIPEVKALTINLGPLGFVWNRPVAVLVEGGETPGRTAITDITRLTQIAVASAALLAAAIARYLTNR